jgi:DNA mismatch repair ATPase MutS
MLVEVFHYWLVIIPDGMVVLHEKKNQDDRFYPMNDFSILSFTDNPDLVEGGEYPPSTIPDLNLDQLLEIITTPKKEYDLAPFYLKPLICWDEIKNRQEIFKDLEIADVLSFFNSFAEKMSQCRRYLELSKKIYYKRHQQGWFLEAALVYCDAVHMLSSHPKPTRSKGLLDFFEYVRRYSFSDEFLSLANEAPELKKSISSLQYNLLIKENWISVRKNKSEIDYSIEVEDFFAKFHQGEVKNYRIELSASSGVNHVHEKILDGVAKLFPDEFRQLDLFCRKFAAFFDRTIETFDREIQFFIAYIDFMNEIMKKGLSFCYPSVTNTDKEVFAMQTFDIALAGKNLYFQDEIVVNDFFLKGKERIIIVSGPNQGGKTTFARMFGQLHFLASLGCPVPGTKAGLFLPDRIFTHFEKEEDIRSLRGKLQDDLIRIHEILEQATTESIIILNEIFTSTTLEDAIFLSKEIMQKIIRLDALCVCVSFIDELSTIGEQTVSMVSTIVPDNPVIRTFKILRKPADGLAHALSIAEKHQVTYDRIKERISR